MGNILQSIVGEARRRAHGLFVGPRGRGRPVAQGTWEEEYRSGAWEVLSSLDELGHYMIILGYVQYAHPFPAILDVGCGSGRLLELSRLIPVESYTGIDLSQEAIRQARARAVHSAHLEVADFTIWQPSGTFDVLIFNESLYYADRPLDVLLRYSKFLNPGGSLVVSMHRTRSQNAIWKMLETRFQVHHATLVGNPQESWWDVKLIAPPTEPMFAPARSEA